MSWEIDILLRSIASVVMKNERQKFPRTASPFLQTFCSKNCMVIKKRTSQILPGRVIMKRSISESGWVANMESEFTIAIISMPGIHMRWCIYFWARPKSIFSCSLGVLFTQRRESKESLYSENDTIVEIKSRYIQSKISRRPLSEREDSVEMTENSYQTIEKDSYRVYYT